MIHFKLSLLWSFSQASQLTEGAWAISKDHKHSRNYGIIHLIKLSARKQLQYSYIPKWYDGRNRYQKTVEAVLYYGDGSRTLLHPQAVWRATIASRNRRSSSIIWRWIVLRKQSFSAQSHILPIIKQDGAPQWYEEMIEVIVRLEMEIDYVWKHSHCITISTQ
jgi:hypothetical protein